MALLGFTLPDMPEESIPQLHDDLDDISDRRMMDLFRRYTAWCGYTGVEVTLAEIEEQAADALLRKHEAFDLIRSWSEQEGPASGRRVAVAKAEKYTSPDVQDMLEDHAVKKAKRKLLQTLLTNYERELNAVSRELTRRGQLAPADRRGTTKFGA